MRSSKRKIAGVVSIEFALGFMAFWTLITGWIEASYISYVSALGDYAIAEAARSAKKEHKDHLNVFKKIIDSDDAVWSGWVDSTNFKVRVNYIDSLADLEVFTGNPVSDEPEVEYGNSTWSAIAIYHVSYDYNGIFTFLMEGETVFDREVIVVQEYQRKTAPASGS